MLAGFMGVSGDANFTRIGRASGSRYERRLGRNGLRGVVTEQAGAESLVFVVDDDASMHQALE